MPNKKDPIDTIIECIEIFNEASYEDSEVSEHELKMAKRRFNYALRYIIVNTVEQFKEFNDEKVEIQSDTSAFNNA